MSKLTETILMLLDEFDYLAYGCFYGEDLLYVESNNLLELEIRAILKVDGWDETDDSLESKRYVGLIEQSKGITYELIDNIGGLYDGADLDMIYEFKNDEESIFVKFSGVYSSCNGNKYYKHSITKQIQKVITIWE